MPSRIESIGTAVPQNAISQKETFLHAKQYCCQNLRQERVLESLYSRTTIKSRSSVLHSLQTHDVNSDFFGNNESDSPKGPTTGERLRKYSENAPDLAIAACVDAFSKTDTKVREITHLITVSCTGFYSPGFDIALVEKLSLPTSVFRTHVGYMGCHGAFNALRVADAFITANPLAVVILCAVEICTIHFQYGWTADSLVANSLFADGAGAMLLRANGPELIYSCSRSTLVPASKEAMTWTIGDHGFEMTLSAEVPNIIESHLKEFVDQWLYEKGLKVADIGGWAVHPGGPKILDSVELALGLSSSALAQSREVLSEHGNMSSPTVLFILQKLLAGNLSRPYVMLGFGPGLTIEAALIR
ncbi:MAG: type III polyketide synthase [Candidatus Obscuribacterales bacterium]|nr:type III polyketide synthase [Candidatus Obscuribacterales bacterium]